MWYGRHRVALTFLGLILAGLRLCALALIAYDCTAPNVNVSEINSVHITGCEDDEDTAVEKNVRLQLLQINEELKTEVTTCIVSVSRIVNYCGMHSHTSSVAGGYAEYILELREQACNMLYDTGSVMLSPTVSINGLERESPNVRAVVLAGSVNVDGACQGAPYSDQYGSWTNVIVQATVKVKATRYMALVNTKTDTVHLRNNVKCTWSKGTCMDGTEGETYWKSVTVDGCSQGHYSVLYEGPAVEIYQNRTESGAIGRYMYLVENGEKIFALERGATFADCPFNIWRTEHPRLLLAFPSEAGFYIKKQLAINAAYDLMLYINAKFVYMTRIYERNFRAIAAAITKERCLTQKADLKTHMSLAVSSPAEFAYLYTGEPGYTATVIGEVIYLTRCPAVQVSLRPVTTCYNELPVTSGNRSMFMLPRSHVLTRYGTEILCNPLLVAKYYVAGSWIASGREVREVRGPGATRVSGTTLYEYRAPRTVALGGIYSAAEVSNMIDQLMFGAERQAAFSRLAGKVMNHPVTTTGLNMAQLVPPDQLERVAESIMRRAWNRIMMFGSLISSMLGIWFIIKCSLWIIESFSNLKILHDLFGWSFKLVYSISTALTTFLVHTRVRANVAEYARTKPSTLTPKDPQAPVPDENENQELIPGGRAIYPSFTAGI